jgi:predicted TIM-barrel fold metal-dependent hydrolase
MLAGRIDSLLPMLSRKSEGRELHVEGAMEQMRRLYFDVTGASSTGAIAALRALMPVDHILYGSDLPMVDPQADLEELDHSGFTAADRRILEEENARRLLPRLAAHYPSEGTPGAAASEMR